MERPSKCRYFFSTDVRIAAGIIQQEPHIKMSVVKAKCAFNDGDERR